MTPLRSTVELGRQVPRGQPVIALAMILAMWIAVRMTFIALEGDPAVHRPELARLADASPPDGAAPLRAAPPPEPPLEPAQGPTDPDRQCAGLATFAVPYVPRRGGSAGTRHPAESHHAALALRPAPQRGAGRRRGQAVAGSVPPTDWQEPGGPERDGLRLAYLATPREGAGDAPREAAQGRPSHWSADGWLLVRSGETAPALAAAGTAYGGSQAGAVLRYAFARGSVLRPQAYLRVSSALGARTRQNEAALGLMLRPSRRLPVSLLGEWRLQQQPGQTRSRPVIMAVTQLPPWQLPFGAEAEVYAQGGWAGGRDATAFYDLAATAQRRVVRPRPGTQLSVGGGVWSGGQRGAVRLDVGPRIELRGMVGPPARRIGVRVGVDWRFRVAGHAEPGSGPALTVAAGF